MLWSRASHLNWALYTRMSMSPEQKFHSYVTTATIFVMYVLISKLFPEIDNVGTASKYVTPVVTILSAFGIYNLLAKLLLSASRNLKWLKKYLLGATYLDGTWAGEFINSRNERIITIEVFEQTISSLIIRGEAFNQDGTTYAQWSSVACSINSQDGVLTYTYTCDSNMNYSVFQCLGVFKFDRKASHLAPKFIKGYSVDITDGVKTENRERKISDDLHELHEAFKMVKTSV